MARKAKKAKTPKRFDGEALGLGVGVGVVCAGLGALIIWGILTAPGGPPSELYSMSVTQRLARMIPESIAQRIALGLGGLFVLFGVMTFFMGLWWAIRGFFRR